MFWKDYPNCCIENRLAVGVGWGGWEGAKVDTHRDEFDERWWYFGPDGWIAEVVINGHILEYSQGRSDRIFRHIAVHFERKDLKHHDFIFCGLSNWKCGLAINWDAGNFGLGRFWWEKHEFDIRHFKFAISIRYPTQERLLVFADETSFLKQGKWCKQEGIGSSSHAARFSEWKTDSCSL